MDWLVNIAQGVAANAVTALLGYIIKYFVVGDQSQKLSQAGQARSLAEVVDYYVEQQRLAEMSRRPVYERRIEREVIIKSQREESAEGLGILLLILAVIAILAEVWNTYKIQFYWVTLVGVSIGWVISFYFADVLQKVAQPHRLEDNLLSWGSMAVWVLGMLGLYFGVFHPLYPESVTRLELDLMLVQAMQLLGAACIYIAIVTTATLQFTVASVYRKGLRAELPNKIEVVIWRWRWLGIALVAIALSFGFLWVSGLWFQIF